MVNRIADRILSAVLPHQRAAAPCGTTYYNQRCYCSRGLVYYKRCRDCTFGPACGGCTIIGSSC